MVILYGKLWLFAFFLTSISPGQNKWKKLTRRINEMKTFSLFLQFCFKLSVSWSSKHKCLEHEIDLFILFLYFFIFIFIFVFVFISNDVRTRTILMYSFRQCRYGHLGCWWTECHRGASEPSQSKYLFQGGQNAWGTYKLKDRKGKKNISRIFLQLCVFVILFFVLVWVFF